MPHNVRDLVAREYGDALAGDPKPADVTVGTSAVQLVGYNAKRDHLSISNFGNGNVAIGLDPSVTATTGWPLAPGSVLELDWREDHNLVTRQLYGISAVAGNACHIVETVLTGIDSTS